MSADRGKISGGAQGSASAAGDIRPSILPAVRRATADRHRRLEALPIQVRLLEDDYALAEYGALLRRLYGFYAPLAVAAQDHAHLEDWGARIAARAHLLRGDLEVLGVGPEALRAVARCSRLPALHSLDQVLGCAYVLEGATLGGRVIFKHLLRLFADRPTGLSFFAGDGERTAERWRAFCAVLDAQAADVDDVCESACAAFDALEFWLAGSEIDAPARAVRA